MSSLKQDLLRDRKSNLNKFLEQRMPVLVEFFESLGFQDSYLVLLETDAFVKPFSDFMEDQTIDDEDRNWIHVRVGYLIGEWYIQSKGGFWEIDENPDSRPLPIGRRLEQFLVD